MKTLPAVVGNGFIWQAEKWELSSSLSWMTAFPGAMSSFGLVSQGKEQIEWINGFPPKAVAVGQCPHKAEVFLGWRQASHHQSRATSARQWQGSLWACPVSCALSRDPHRVLGTLCFLQHRGLVRLIFFLPLTPEAKGCSKSSTELQL